MIILSLSYVELDRTVFGVSAECKIDRAQYNEKNDEMLESLALAQAEQVHAKYVLFRRDTTTFGL